MIYRSFLTSKNLIVIAGKNALQNDSIVKTAKKDDLILHTEARGSPFCVIRAEKGKIDSQSIKEAAIFCAAFGKGWKQGKKIVEVHVFNPVNVYKRKGMAVGTYGVKKVMKKIKIVPILALGRKGKQLQCSAPSSLDKIYVKIKQGRMEKEEAAEEIIKILKKKRINTTKERIMQLIPAGGLSIK